MAHGNICRLAKDFFSTAAPMVNSSVRCRNLEDLDLSELDGDGLDLGDHDLDEADLEGLDLEGLEDLEGMELEGLDEIDRSSSNEHRKRIARTKRARTR